MATVAFKKGLLASLPSSYVEGTLYVTTDERAIYLDVDDSTRIRIGDFQEFATLEDLQANTNPSTTALYYIADLNVLAKWNGANYVQINLDTGATSVEVVGSGNAVTEASYDPVSRKLTLTMGKTFATPDDVDSKLAAAKTELIGTDGDTGTSDTIKGAKKYAEEQIAAQVASAYKAAGSVEFASLPALSATEEGKVYNVTDAFSTTEDFIEGAGKSYPAGTNVVCIDTGDETFKWDVLAGMVDLSAYDTAEVAAGKVATAKQEAIDAAAADATSKANAALEDAKEYADGLNTAMDGRVAAVEADKHTHANKALLDTYTQTEENLADAVAKKHTHANATELDKIADGDKAKWDAMEQNAKDYADGLAVNYDAAGSADAAETAAKEYTDTALTWGSF